MSKFPRIWISMLCLAAAMAAPAPVFAAVQTRAVTRSAAVAPDAAPPAETDPGYTQEQLLKLLRVTPTLADVVANDPSLLADQEYVGKTNPELAAFLQQHPEVARNPGFYLFSDLRRPGHRSYEVMSPKSGFEEHHRDERSQLDIFMNNLAPLVAMFFFCGALIWLIKLILQNKRWKLTFKLHSEVHTRLIDKMGTSQEMLAYMDTEAGRRFLEAAPIATEIDSARVPNVVSKVMTTLQVGVVMTLLGIGLLLVRNYTGDAATGVLVLGVLVLMPGIGCIVSAWLSWAIAQRLGLMPAVEESVQR